MIAVKVKFLGGQREAVGTSSMTLQMAPDATISDLEVHLRTLGIDPSSDDIIITLNNRGLRQWPPERRFAPGDVVTIFPNIAGG
jgi:molybdopterin converting factor small subunit